MDPVHMSTKTETCPHQPSVLKNHQYGSISRAGQFQAVCKECRKTGRLGKEGGCQQIGTTALHNHMKRNHPHLLKRTPAAPTATSASTPAASFVTSCVAKSPQTQLTLLEAMNRNQSWTSTHPLAMEHNKQLGEYIAKSMKPLSMVVDPAFIDFMCFCAPKWNIPSRGYFANSAIPALETVIAEALKVHLKECVGEVLLTTDIWSSRQVNDFMFVTAHWITPDFKGSLTRNNAVLDMSGFGQQHTAYNIGQKLEDVVETWLVPLGVKVGIVTSNNAQNVVKALNDRGMKHAPCMAHCLNLVVKASLTKSGAELEETFKAARAIVGHFRHSASAQRQLEAIQL
ncbi:zinc finger BED domain-containing protein 4-like [Ixodes scapularis]